MVTTHIQFTFCIQKFGYSQTFFSNIKCIVQICFMLTGPQQAIVNNIRPAKYIQKINNVYIISLHIAPFK